MTTGNLCKNNIKIKCLEQAKFSVDHKFLTSFFALSNDESFLQRKIVFFPGKFMLAFMCMCEHIELLQHIFMSLKRYLSSLNFGA